MNAVPRLRAALPALVALVAAFALALPPPVTTSLGPAEAPSC